MISYSEWYLIYIYLLILPYVILALDNYSLIYKSFLGANSIAFILVFMSIVSKNYFNIYISITLEYSILVVLLVSVFLELFYVFNYKVVYEKSTLNSILDTNKREVNEFIELFVNRNLIYIIILILLPFILLNSLNLKLLSLITISIGFVFLVLNTKRVDTLLDNTFIKLITMIYLSVQQRKNISNYAKQDFNYSSQKIKSIGPEVETVILIIGESLNRNRMSLYGYKRKTTPNLDLLQQEFNLYVYDDVISTNSYTRLVLPKIMTFFDSSSDKDWNEYLSLIGIYKALKYKTYWVSNQEKSGINGGNISNALSSLCDYKYFSTEETDFGKINTYDEQLLPILEDVEQESGKKLIVVHLLGNHFNYAKRYPETFQYFTDDDFIMKKSQKLSFLKDEKVATYNEYDNSILYNDYIVSKIFSLFNKDSSIALYISDHGEEVYDERDYFGHNQEQGSRYMAEIPFILQVSQQYKNENSILVEQISSSTDKPFISDYLIHFLLKITNITCMDFEKDNCLLEKMNTNSNRKFLNFNYEQDLKSQSNFKLSKKLWLHRTNSLAKLEKSKEMFHGVEIDVFYEDKIFKIKHNSNEVPSLTIDEYFSSLSKEMHIWLDFKNLNKNNCIDIKNNLILLIAKYNVNKGNIILESSDYNSLHFLHDTFYVSYYLPYLTNEEMKDNKILVDIIKNIKDVNINAISFPGYMYSYVKTNIVKHRKDLELLMWLENKKYFENIDDHDYINNLIYDNDLKVILISAKKNSTTKNNLLSKNNKLFSIKMNKMSTQLNSFKKYDSIVLYGAGVVSELIFNSLDNVCCVVDINEDKINQMFYTKTIKDPQELAQIKFDRVLITVLGREEEISNYLVDTVNIDLNRILTFDLS